MTVPDKPTDIERARRLYEQSGRIMMRSQAASAMHAAVAMALECAHTGADHREADVFRADLVEPRGALHGFLTKVQHEARSRAENALSHRQAPELPSKVRISIVVPQWFNTARGPLGPLEAPEWTLVPTWNHIPPVAHATVLASVGKQPSLLALDWDWVGVWAVTTPAYDPAVHVLPGETRTCTFEACQGEGRVAA